MTYKSTKEVTAEIRATLKKTFPKCRFSCTFESFAGGSSTTVALMKAPFEVLKKTTHWNDGYAQLNEYQLADEHRDRLELRCNGALLTAEGWKLMAKVVNIMRDTKHFDRYTFMHVEIGKWDKPFIVK